MGGGQPGDVYVEIVVTPHPTFQRNGDDLHCTLDVPMTAAALGSTITLDTFDGAHDVHDLTSLVASWTGTDLGDLRPVTPPVRFGFGSTPARPSVTAVTTTILSGPRGVRGTRASAR